MTAAVLRSPIKETPGSVRITHVTKCRSCEMYVTLLNLVRNKKKKDTMTAEAKNNVIFSRRGKFRRLQQRAASDFRCDRLTEVTKDIANPNLVTAFTLMYSTKKYY